MTLNEKEIKTRGFGISRNNKYLPRPYRPILYQEASATNTKHTLMSRENAGGKEGVMNRLLTSKLILSAAFIAVLTLVACQQAAHSPVPPGKTTIGDLRGAPTAYEGKVVTIEGKYQGWKGGFGGPPVTRSDWLVQDATGWIYVTGKPSGLDPLDDVGHPIKVKGLIEITKNGEPYLYAQEIEIKAKKASALLLLQIDLREKQLAAPSPERLKQMKAMGMRTDNLGIQRIFIHLVQELTPSQIDELEAIGITHYPDSWIPPVGGHPTGFIVADMPVGKLDELAGKDYVVWLDTAEQVVEPQTEEVP